MSELAKFDFLTSKAIVWKSAQVDKVALHLTKNKILKKNNENANALQMRLFPPSLKEKEKQKRRSRLAKYKYSDFFRDISTQNCFVKMRMRWQLKRGVKVEM